MSKKNYTNYSNKKTENSEVETAVEEVVEQVTEECLTEKIVEQPAPEPQPTYGYVIGCERLNVRKTPGPSGLVLEVINSTDRVTINQKQSAHEWYKVITASGTEGFCMKKFIAVEK